MWGFVAILTLASVGSSLGSDECMSEMEEVECVRFREVFSIFPIDAEGLDTFCEGFQSSLACAINEYKKCSSGRQIMENFLEHVLRYAERSCNPDSEIYQVISANLQCLASETQYHEFVCLWNKTTEFLFEHQKDLEERGISEDCQYNALELLCQVGTVGGKCGEDVGLAVLDIMINTKYGLNQCPADFVEKIPDVFQTLLIILEMEKTTLEEIKEK